MMARVYRCQTLGYTAPLLFCVGSVHEQIVQVSQPVSTRRGSARGDCPTAGWHRVRPRPPDPARGDRFGQDLHHG
ncbi:hypothetical protein AERO8C_160037 [Aeromonas veronii]|uniref:Uncharacterized protein n=1 Tax=Aeromonas veronii TaxID=654 RepID=A0A653KXJ2_AERVE|nr:hypothetical protein AERO8C_160037 [Aeromonas veronii]